MAENCELGRQLGQQLGRAYGMLRDTILNIPEDVWRVKPENGPLPAYVACHVIEIQDCWTSGLTEEQFPWGRTFGALPEMAPEDLPDQAQVVARLDEVAEQTMAFVARTDADLLAPVEGFDWADGTTFTLMLHGLRHVMHHQGQLSVVQWRHNPEADGTWR